MNTPCVICTDVTHKDNVSHRGGGGGCSSSSGGGTCGSKPVSSGCGSASGNPHSTGSAQRTVLSEPFCRAVRSGSLNCVKAPTSCCTPNAGATCGKGGGFLRRLLGPFDPRKEFRQLAYQPLKKKNLVRKISTNTLHGVDSVNDLRSWSLNKEERRKHYLEQMIMASEQAGGEEEDEDEGHGIAGVEETHIPIPHLRKKEEAELKKDGKSVDKVIAEEYHEKQEKAKSKANLKKDASGNQLASSSSSAAGASKSKHKKGSKEVQTPKLSISNILEELSEDEQKKLYNAMKQQQADDEAKEGGGSASSIKGDQAKDDEIRKLRDRVKDLQNEYDKVQDEKDGLAKKVKEGHPPQKDDETQTEEDLGEGEGKSKIKDRPVASVTGVSRSDTNQSISANDSEDKDKPASKQASATAGTTKSTTGQPTPGTSGQSTTGTTRLSQQGDTRHTTGCDDCQYEALRCEYATLELTNIQLQQRLTQETQRFQDLLYEYNTLQNELSEIQTQARDMEQSIVTQMNRDNEFTTQISELLGNLDNEKVQKFQLIQLNRTLEQEIARLRAIIGDESSSCSAGGRGGGVVNNNAYQQSAQPVTGRRRSMSYTQGVPTYGQQQQPQQRPDFLNQTFPTLQRYGATSPSNSTSRQAASNQQYNGYIPQPPPMPPNGFGPGRTCL